MRKCWNKAVESLKVLRYFIASLHMKIESDRKEVVFLKV